jgi:hypothetical protein
MSIPPPPVWLFGVILMALFTMILATWGQP